jgi:hypothetical protein
MIQMKSIREKARYILPDTVNLRLYPDHTRLLAENEAYLSLDGNSCPAKEIIAMRVCFCNVLLLSERCE